MTFGSDAVVFVLQAPIYYPDVLLIVVSEGDVALKTFGSAMTAVARESEICARFGGDEFMVAGTAENGKERAEEIGFVKSPDAK